MTVLAALTPGCASVTSAHPTTAIKGAGTGHREFQRHGLGDPVSGQLAAVPYLE
jgi:hypothetical protein